MKAIVTIFAMMTALVAAGQNTFTYRTATASVTLLSEGQGDGRLNILVGATPQMIAQVAPDNTFPTATNVFLIRTQSAKNILIDAGYGRELFANLQSVGVTPESIDVILITHLHGDHTGGLVRDGKKAFPHAKLMMSQLEARSANENTRKIMELYELVTFEPGTQAPVPVFDNVKAMANYGHTPGHTAYFIDNVAIWGDMTHAMAFQMPYPQVAVTYDSDAATAVSSRLAMLQYLVANGYIAGGMHVAYPGLGQLKENGKGGYLFTPLD